MVMTAVATPTTAPSPAAPAVTTPTTTPLSTTTPSTTFLASQLRYHMRNHSLSPHALLLPVLQSLLPHTLLSRVTIVLSLVHAAWLITVCVTFALALFASSSPSSSASTTPTRPPGYGLYTPSNTPCSSTNALRIGASLFVMRYALAFAFLCYDMVHRWLTHRQRKPPTYFMLLTICRTVCVLGTTVSTVIVWGLSAYVCVYDSIDLTLFRVLCALTIYEWTLLVFNAAVFVATLFYVLFAPASWQARWPVPHALLMCVLPSSLAGSSVGGAGGASGVDSADAAAAAAAAAEQLRAGLPHEEIGRLPVERFKATPMTEAGQTMCAICLNDFECDDEVHVFACDHPFHRGCSSVWLVQKSTCPLCVRIVRVEAVLEAHQRRAEVSSASASASSSASASVGSMDDRVEIAIARDASVNVFLVEFSERLLVGDDSGNDARVSSVPRVGVEIELV